MVVAAFRSGDLGGSASLARGSKVTLVPLVVTRLWMAPQA